jgi:predicted nucleotidyltransferase
MTNTAVLDQDPVLAEIVRRLVAEFKPKWVFLFGSRARGEAGEGSDYDLLVIMPMMEVPGYRLAQQAHRHSLKGIPAPVDVIMVSESYFEENKAVIGTLPELAIYEGKELYVAA